MSEPQRISTADLGSNTIKIQHAMLHQDGSIEALEARNNTIRLAAGIETTGMIDQERIDACVRFLMEQEQRGRELGSTSFIGVATEALRIASNGSDLLGRIANETAWDVDVITGDDEAMLTYLGLRDRVPSDTTAAIVDIGGGSTEVIVVDHGKVVWQRSLPIGSGRLADRYFAADPPGMEATAEAFAAALEDLSAIDDIAESVHYVLFSGGNGVFLQELLRQLFGDEPFSIHSTERVLQHLSVTPATDTASRLGIMLARAKVFPAGVAIALAVLTKTRAESAIGVPSGIHAGLIRQRIPKT